MDIKMKTASLATILLLLFLSGTGLAANITLDHDELETLFQDLIFAEVPWDQNDLAVDNFTSKPSYVTIPAGEISYTVLNQIHPQYLGSKTLSVMINVDGVPEQKVKMHGILNLYDDVVVTSHRLRHNTIIGEDDLTISRRKVTGFAHQIIPTIPDAVGLKTTKTLGGGAVLLTRYVQKQSLVHRGDMVTILATNGQLKITTQGVAKTKGAEGDIIKIKNLSSRRIISARVIDQGLVEVEF